MATRRRRLKMTMLSYGLKRYEINNINLSHELASERISSRTNKRSGARERSERASERTSE